MKTNLATQRRFPMGLAVLIAVQLACITFFIGDVVEDFRELAPGDGESFHLGVETIAVLSLLSAILFELRYLTELLQRKSHLERSLKIATSAINDVISAHFDAWKLSASETDVATFLVEGLSIAEIAEVRGCAKGTVKTHLNAIYRKSGTHNRSELLSLVIDSLMANSLKGSSGTQLDQHKVAGGREIASRLRA